MMYQITKKIENIDSFKVFDKYLGFKLKENKRLLYLNEHIVDEDNRGYLFFQNSLCLHNGGKTTFLNLYSKEKTEIPITFNGDIGYFQNTYISSINSKQEDDYRWTSNYVIYQLFPFKELYRLPHRYYGSGYRFENQYIQIQSERTTLKSLSLLTGEYEWEVDLGAYGEIDKIIGVCNEILWVGVGSKMLVGIDMKYGKIIHIIDKPSHFAYQSGAFNYFRGHDGQIDEKAKKLVGFEFDTYYELDLVTMEFTYWIFREEAKAMKIEARYAPQNIHTEDFIYFIDKLNFKIGIFDRKNKTIKEAYVFPENSCTGFLNDLQVTNDKMYVLDTGGTLHIFEKVQA